MQRTFRVGAIAHQICSVALMILIVSLRVQASAATEFTGTLADPQGQLVPNATVHLSRRADSTRREAKTDAQGNFTFGGLDGGEYRLTAESPGFAVLTRTIVVQVEGRQTENLQFSGVASKNESVTVTADVSDAGVFEPDPAQRVMVRNETLDANPGRPGMPIFFASAKRPPPKLEVKMTMALLNRTMRP